MKINIEVQVENDQFDKYKMNVSGSVCFDEFGVVEKVNINSSSMGCTSDCKRDTKSFMRSIGERVRAEVLDKTVGE